jgi:hypothetical protein
VKKEVHIMMYEEIRYSENICYKEQCSWNSVYSKLMWKMYTFSKQIEDSPCNDYSETCV